MPAAVWLWSNNDTQFFVYDCVCFFRLPLEPSALRYITCFEMGDPFIYSVKDGSSEKLSQLEFAVIKVIKAHRCET